MEEEGHSYEIETYFEHLVAEYTGLNMLQVEELQVLDYLQYRRDAFIHQCNQSEAGREYLENAYILEQTKPDRKALRFMFG